MRRALSLVLCTVLFGTLILVFDFRDVSASSTIYIRADGSIDPGTAPISTVDNVTYAFTNHICDEIVVERDNIVVDGANYILQGNGSGTGIYLGYRSNVTIKNLEIKSFLRGIELNSSSYNTISGNTITNNTDLGVLIKTSSNYNTISGNTITNTYHGILIQISSNYNTISGNNITNNAGSGIYISTSSHNTISGNTITNNTKNGILTQFSSNYNTISGNTITNNINGIYIQTSNNTITGNTITDNTNYGIVVEFQNYNTISGNNITNNYCSIYIWISSNNTISGNNITNCTNYGIFVGRASNSKLYHNNFINNAEQVHFYELGYANVWDDGYPSGGNYWSDYSGSDAFTGQYQNETGSDSIGDTAYVMDANNTDRYPLMVPFGPSTTTGENVTVFPSDDVRLTFRNVTGGGSTWAEEVEDGPEAPPDYDMEKWIRIETTAEYEGQIRMWILYDDSNMTLEEEEGLKLMRCDMIPGDVDEDFDVDIFDIVRICAVYDTPASHPRFDPACDLNGDDYIDIFDVVIAATHYDEYWQASTGWTDVTIHVDTANNIIYAETLHLSIYGVTRPRWG